MKKILRQLDLRQLLTRQVEVVPVLKTTTGVAAEELLPLQVEASLRKRMARAEQMLKKGIKQMLKKGICQQHFL